MRQRELTGLTAIDYDIQYIAGADVAREEDRCSGPENETGGTVMVVSHHHLGLSTIESDVGNSLGNGDGPCARCHCQIEGCQCATKRNINLREVRGGT